MSRKNENKENLDIQERLAVLEKHLAALKFPGTAEPDLEERPSFPEFSNTTLQHEMAVLEKIWDISGAEVRNIIRDRVNRCQVARDYGWEMAVDHSEEIAKLKAIGIRDTVIDQVLSDRMVAAAARHKARSKKFPATPGAKSSGQKSKRKKTGKKILKKMNYQ